MENKTQQPWEELPEEQRAKTRWGKLWEWMEFGEKTSWEWMQLLIIPLMISVAGLWSNWAQDAS